MRVNEQIAFQPEAITADEILYQTNAEYRCVLLGRTSFERFMPAARCDEIGWDAGADGVRRLLRIPLSNDEDYVGLSVHDPSTGRQYILRVSPPWHPARRRRPGSLGFCTSWDATAYANAGPVIETAGWRGHNILHTLHTLLDPTLTPLFSFTVRHE